MNYAFNHMPEPAPDADGGSFINYRAVKNWLVFCWRAVKRRKGVIAGVTAALIALSVLALLVMPKRYHVETRLLAQKNQVLALPGEETGGKAPSSAAVETVLNRENLVALVKDTDLLDEWSTRRAPILRAKDWVMGAVTREPTAAERIDGFVKYLQKQLKVVNDDTTGAVSIEVDWPDGPMAYRLVDTAQRSFLEAKHIQETSTIAEQASILEGHAAQLRRDIDTAVRDIQTLRAKKLAEKDDPAAIAAKAKAAKAKEQAAEAALGKPAPVAAAPEPAKLDDYSLRRLSELPVVIEAKRNALRELDGFRQRRLAELQGQLEEKRSSYTEAHPAILDLKQQIAAASKESPQVKNLRGELAGLEGEYERLGGQAAALKSSARGGAGGGGFASSKKDLGDVIRIESTPEEERDPEIEYARAQLKHSITSYQELEQKIQRARIDLDTAEAAFKYRYTVVTPPEIPKGPVSPKAPLVLIGALFAGLFLGLFTAIGLELKKGVLQEPWQVEQFLSMPVIASVRARPELSRP